MYQYKTGLKHWVNYRSAQANLLGSQLICWKDESKSKPLTIKEDQVLKMSETVNASIYIIMYCNTLLLGQVELS